MPSLVCLRRPWCSNVIGLRPAPRHGAERWRDRVARRFRRAWSALRGPPPRRPGDFTDPDLRRALFLVGLFLLGGVAHAEPPRCFTARVTYYEPRSCPYGNVTSTGRFATEGVTVAVDPKLIPYGSRVRIAALDGLVGDGWFLAQDTGSAVKSRKAARRWGSRAPVVDVYVASSAKLRCVERAAPMFCSIEVHP